MQKTADGAFVKVVDLPADKKVLYKFVVDGQWQVDHDAQTEGEGATQNNYLITESAHGVESIASPTGNDAVNGDAVPTLGAAAEYTGSSKSSTGHNFSEVPAITNQGPAPEAWPAAKLSSGPSSSISLEKRAEGLIAGAAVAAAGGLAAGAAALGLQTQAKEIREAAGIMEPVESSHQSAIVPASTKPAAPEMTEALPGATTASRTVADQAVVATETSKLEQAAVQAATLAATNAHNAAGLSGLGGVVPVAKEIADRGNLGFTSVGTAVNVDTGVVGSSKVVQSVDQAKPTEETQTAKLAQGAASALLNQHENGAKVQKLGDHAVLAEVGIGGTALGTAVVTDSSIKAAADLNIPTQAAEHLAGPATSITATEPLIAQSTASPNDSARAVPDSNLSSASNSAAVATASATAAPLDSRAVPTLASPAPVETSLEQPKAMTAAPSPAAVAAATAAAKGPVTPAKDIRAPSTAPPQSSQSTDSKTTDKPKKKNNILRRMKSMFKSKE
ncbi:Cruciform DNA binding protein [Savitreella phatthalungensis]